MRYWPVIILVFFSSCLDYFLFEKRITKNYYLIAADSKEELEIMLKLKNGDYIGRIPEKVEQYAIVNDTLIFARTTKGYYVLNTVRDNDFAEVRDVVVGPIDQIEFNRDWSSKYNIKFRLPE